MLAFVALDLGAVEDTTSLNRQVKPNGKYCNLIGEYTFFSQCIAKACRLTISTESRFDLS